jgi:hypothetical protein
VQHDGWKHWWQKQHDGETALIDIEILVSRLKGGYRLPFLFNL